ncbi:unnamed protein product [Thlaspi arvense]|uniref:Hexosyltransferase n=1 Tax=Thlaspi arvense TaxID=13288 RepID=A0AAU9S3R1_THLAR|nr:unnamed protein product [Thlaspi arvense]
MAPELTQTMPAKSTVMITKPSPQIHGGDRAYVTFLAGNGDYVKGVVGLAKGLRKVNSAYPLVVAILPDVPEEHRRILVEQGCIVREIEPVYPPENQTQFAMAYYVINYSKLRIWKDFLNMYFKKIYKPIPLVYNLVLAMLWRHPENVELDKVKVVHYCAAGSKPWRYTGKEANMEREDIKMLVNKWWEIYNDDSLDYKKSVAVADLERESGLVNLKPFITALTEVERVKYVTAPSAA